MKIGRIVAVLAALALTVTGVAGEVQVQAVGIGVSYRSAVGEALLSALEQYRGVTISSTERAEVMKSATSSSVAQNGQVDDQRKLAINDEVKRSVQQMANGRILGFAPLDDSYDAATGKYRVRVNVRFAGPYVVGLNPANRRRMAVATFRDRKSVV